MREALVVAVSGLLARLENAVGSPLARDCLELLREAAPAGITAAELVRSCRPFTGFHLPFHCPNRHCPNSPVPRPDVCPCVQLSCAAWSGRVLLTLFGSSTDREFAVHFSWRCWQRCG